MWCCSGADTPTDSTPGAPSRRSMHEPTSSCRTSVRPCAESETLPGPARLRHATTPRALPGSWPSSGGVSSGARSRAGTSSPCSRANISHSSGGLPPNAGASFLASSKTHSGSGSYTVSLFPSGPCSQPAAVTASWSRTFASISPSQPLAMKPPATGSRGSAVNVTLPASARSAFASACSHDAPARFASRAARSAASKSRAPMSRSSAPSESPGQLPPPRRVRVPRHRGAVAAGPPCAAACRREGYGKTFARIDSQFARVIPGSGREGYEKGRQTAEARVKTACNLGGAL